MSESVRIEWGVQWPGGETETGRPDHMEADGGEDYARRVVQLYHGQGARLVRCEVRRGPWTASDMTSDQIAADMRHKHEQGVA